MVTSKVGKRVIGLGWLACALVTGCSASVADDEGGTGEANEALRRRPARHGFEFRGLKPHPHHRHGDCGPGGHGGSARACTRVGPMLIDDFEDGDTASSSTPSGAWFSANDGTAGAVQSPNPWVPTAGGADGSAFAACTNGSGFLNWGALIGMVFPASETPNDLSCLDVSRLHGVRFKARGTGLVKLNLATRATTSVDFGGLCTGTACDFPPSVPLVLSPDWQTFEVTWPSVTPGNLPFDPRDLLGLQYQAYDPLFPAAAPIAFDFCIDDMELF